MNGIARDSASAASVPFGESAAQPFAPADVLQPAASARG